MKRRFVSIWLMCAIGCGNALPTTTEDLAAVDQESVPDFQGCVAPDVCQPANQCQLEEFTGVRSPDSPDFTQCGPGMLCCPPHPPPPPPPPPPSSTGRMRPKYKVLTVVYAPPGTTGGSSLNSVSYGTGSTFGTTASSSFGFKQSYSVSVKAGLHFLGNGGGASVSFGYDRNSFDSQSVDIQKSSASTLDQTGPAADGIDHDRDQIWLWLRPQMGATVTGSSVQWTIDTSATMNVQFVYVGHLKDPSLMAPGLKAQLDAAGLTTADYAAILRADPFAFGDVPVDPTRFAVINRTFPYEPPFAPGDSSPSFGFTAQYTFSNTTSTSSTVEYSAGVTIEGDANFLGVFKASLKTEDSWTWTDEVSRSQTAGSSQSASVTVGGPSFGYTGPTDVEVLYDLIYKTFAFKFVPPGFAQPVRGMVVSTSGASIAGKEVEVVVDGVSYRTLTNAAGEFRAFAPRSTGLQVRAGGTHVAAATRGEPIVIRVP